MVKITNFVFCEDDENFKSKNGLFAPASIIEVEDEQFTMNVVMSLCNYTIEEQHSCTLNIKDPHNNEIFSTNKIEIPLETPGGVDNENAFVGFTLGVSFSNLSFRGTGVYSVDVLFDDDRLDTFYIPVTFSKEGE